MKWPLIFYLLMFFPWKYKMFFLLNTSQLVRVSIWCQIEIIWKSHLNDKNKTRFVAFASTHTHTRLHIKEAFPKHAGDRKCTHTYIILYIYTSKLLSLSSFKRIYLLTLYNNNNVYSLNRISETWANRFTKFHYNL